MNRLFVLALATAASLPPTASAARTSTSFHVGITIEHDCTVSRTPDGSDVSVACDVPIATHALDLEHAWPPPAWHVAASSTRQVDESARMRVIVVEY